MGLTAYRTLAPSLQRPTLRYHLHWALRVNGEYMTDELMDYLMARGENTVCGCLHDPQRLRGVIRNYWRGRKQGASSTRGAAGTDADAVDQFDACLSH